MVKIYDFSDNELSYKNGTYGGMAGSKDGILIDGEEWIIKYPKSLSQMEGENASYSSAPLSEYLGSHIYQTLGYKTHDTLLGIRNGKLVVACKDFATDGKMLMEIRTIKNHTGKELSDLLEQKGIPSSESHVVDLDELMLHLDKNPVLSVIPDIKKQFFEQAVVDIFINNNDRNNGNWGILREKGKKDIIAPVFDNGGSFMTKMAENKIQRILERNNPKSLSDHATDIRVAYGKNGKQFNAKTFMKECEHYPEYQNAIIKVTENIEGKIEEIKALIDKIPEYCKDKDGNELEVCSKARKELYKKHIDIRLNELLIPEMEKLKELSKVDKEYAINTITRDGLFLGQVSDELKDDRDIVLAAVRQNPESMQYASDELKDNTDFCIQAVMANPAVIKYVPEDIREQVEGAVKILTEMGKEQKMEVTEKKETTDEQGISNTELERKEHDEPQEQNPSGDDDPEW